jgi:hypothetical protein
MSLVELSRENATCLPSGETADLLGDAIVRDGLTNHSGDGWLRGRLILRMRVRRVNE